VDRVVEKGGGGMMGKIPEKWFETQLQTEHTGKEGMGGGKEKKKSGTLKHPGKQLCGGSWEKGKQGKLALGQG